MALFSGSRHLPCRHVCVLWSGRSPRLFDRPPRCARVWSPRGTDRRGAGCETPRGRIGIVWARTFSCRPCPRCGSPGKERQRRLLEGTAGREPHRATAAGVSGSLVRKNDWLAAERDPRFKRPYTELSYQPMIELLAYLRTGALATRSTTTSPGRYAGMDNGWALSLIQPMIIPCLHRIFVNVAGRSFPKLARFTAWTILRRLQPEFHSGIFRSCYRTRPRSISERLRFQLAPLRARPWWANLPSGPDSNHFGRYFRPLLISGHRNRRPISGTMVPLPTNGYSGGSGSRSDVKVTVTRSPSPTVILG